MNKIAQWFPGLLLAGLLSAASLPAVADSQTLTLDPHHTQVRVTWNHMGFSNPGANFDIAKGTLIWDAEHPDQSSVSVSIPVDSVDTRISKLDTELQSSNFFDAKKYPGITFKSTNVKPLDAPNHYRIDGKLTMHGVTQPVTLQATLNKAGEHPMLHVPAVGFDATTAIKRSEFGLGAFTPLISDQIKIHITVEAVPHEALAQEEQKAKAAAESD